MNVARVHLLISRNNSSCYKINDSRSVFLFCDVTQRLLYMLKQKKSFNKNEVKKWYLSGSAPALIYGTPKMHKHCRILQFVGTFNYKLSHFFCHLLSLLAPNNYCCKYTFYFVPQIKNAYLSGNFLVFFDVTSIFTNFPFQETIDIGIDLKFNHNPNLNITK